MLKGHICERYAHQLGMHRVNHFHFIFTAVSLFSKKKYILLGGQVKFNCEWFVCVYLWIFHNYATRDIGEKGKNKLIFYQTHDEEIDLSSIYLSLSLIACVDKSRWILLCYDKSFTDYFSFLFCFEIETRQMDIFFVIFISRFCRFIFSLFLCL